MKLSNFKTYVDKPTNLDHKWYILDATDLTLGRMASTIAKILVGKHKPTYTPHMDNGDWVIVINTDKVKLTGNKEEDKIYYRYSGYRGGIKARNVASQRKLDSRKIIYNAVKGMLPKNKLRALRLNRLKIYTDDNHLHHGQKPEVLNLKNIGK